MAPCWSQSGRFWNPADLHLAAALPSPSTYPGNTTVTDASKLYAPAFWSDTDQVHRLFAELRKRDPLPFVEADDYPNFWHATKHADIFEIEKRTDVFVNEPRQVVTTLTRENAVRILTGGNVNLIRSLVSLDGPTHAKLRHLTQAWFMPKNLGKLQPRIDASASASLDQWLRHDGSTDFAKEIAQEFPLRVIMAVLGVPPIDYPVMLRLTQELFGPHDPDTRREAVDASSDPIADLRQTFSEFSAYFTALSEDRKRSPRDDVATLIANASLDGAPIGPDLALGYYIIIATAGHDTTSYTLTEAVRQLSVNPHLLKRLKSDPDNIAPRITEEALRYASPVRHFVRTATSDYNIRGRAIKSGQSIILWYPSGSRDEEVFESPDSFDIDRKTEVRHAAFGHGAHMCLGMHLARQEINSFLRQMASRVNGLEPAGQPKWMQANFVGGIKSLPLQLAS